MCIKERGEDMKLDELRKELNLLNGRVKEVLKKSGKDLLTAVVAEYEVYQRVALAGDTNIVGFNIFACLF